MPHQHSPLPSVQNTNNPVDNETTSSLDHSEEYERLNHSQLKARCQAQGFACGGNRNALIQRLRAHDTRRANTQHQQPRGLPPSAAGHGPTRARDGMIAISDTALLVGVVVIFVALVGQLVWLLVKDYLSYENVITILEWRWTVFWWVPLMVGVTLAVGKFFLFGIFHFSPLYLLISFLNTTVVFSASHDSGVRPDYLGPPSQGEEVDPTTTFSPVDSGEPLPESIPLPPSPTGNGNEMDILPLDTRWIDTELCRGLDTLKDDVGWKVARERHGSHASLVPPSLPPTPGLFTNIPKRFLICRALSEASLKEQAVQDRDLYSDSCQSLSQEVSGLKGQETEIQGLNRRNEVLGGMVRRASRDLFLARRKVWTVLRIRDRTDADGEESNLDYALDLQRMVIEFNASKQFTFDCVLAPPISTRAVFEKVEPLTQATLQGFNLYIIADGQSGSGKSYTMINGPSPIATSAVTSLFTEIHRGNPDYKILMTCSILEIYKEQARDLLSNTQVEISRLGKISSGCSCHNLYTADDLDALLRKACAQRTDRSTHQNQHSSRSDLVIIITIVQSYIPAIRNHVSKLVFIDLAGSESLSSISSEDAAEAKMIKKGRASLQRMMIAYQESNNFIPDSQLTQLLRPCFDGQSKVVLLATASPLEKDRKATQATLEFANQIRNGAAKPPAKGKPQPT